MKRVPVLDPMFAVAMTLVPSGVQEGNWQFCPDTAAISWTSEPSTSMTYSRSFALARVDVKAILEPSGDRAGHPSKAA